MLNEKEAVKMGLYDTEGSTITAIIVENCMLFSTSQQQEEEIMRNIEGLQEGEMLPEGLGDCPRGN